MQVLVLDDSGVMREILVRHLLAVGLQADEIQEARNGEEALEKAKTVDFDIMLLDIVMDGIDGISVFKETRISQSRARVIMCSTFSESRAVKELIDMGIDDFIVKPFSEDRLKDALRRNIEAVSANHT
jgi:YesN/AraC family two-component response regulator